MNKNLISKFILFSYGTWISLIIGLITVGISTRILSPDVFGKASLFNTLVSLILVLSIVGVDQAFVRYYYELNEESRKLLLLKCLLFPLISTILIWCILILKSEEISTFIFGEVNFNAIIVLGLTVVFEVFHRYSLLILRLKQHANTYSIITIISKVLELIIILVLFYTFGSNYLILPLSLMLMSFLVSIGIIVFTFSDWNFFSLLNEQNLKTPKFEDIFKYSYPLMFSLILHWAFTSIDKFALNALSSFYEVGIYASVSKLIFLMTAVQSAFTNFWTPVSLERYSKDPNDFTFFKKVTRNISLIILILIILLIMCKDIFVYILGNEYASASLLMPFAVFGPALYTISEITVVGIAFSKKTKWNILISLIVAIINIIGNILLIPKIGALGAAISTSISYIIFLIMRTLISNKLYPVDYPIKELFVSISLTFFYSMLVSFYNIFFLNIFFGVFIILIEIVLFQNEVRIILVSLKKSINNYFISVR